MIQFNTQHNEIKTTYCDVIQQRKSNPSILSREIESDRGLRPPRDTAKDLKHSLGGVKSRAVEIRSRAEEEIRREKD